jgi:hypothetical protein
MKFTRNQYQHQQKQINGQQFTILGFEPNGQIQISTKGKTQTVTPEVLLYSDYRYADTVHSSQGQTANYCLYAAGSGNSLTVGRESFYVAASRARQEFTVYTGSARDLGVAILQSRGQENALPLVTRKTSAPVSHPREAEFKLLVAAKYLVEHQGKDYGSNSAEKVYQSSDGTEIRRTSNSLTITQGDRELEFNHHNTTVNNTFPWSQIESQIEARTAEVEQHQQLISKKQTQEWSISR